MKIIGLFEVRFKNLYEYLNNLPEYLQIEVNNQTYILVHAGVDVKIPLEKQDINTLLWIREDLFQRGDLTKIYILSYTYRFIE